MQDVAHKDAAVDLGALIENSPISPVQLTTFFLCGLIALLDGADTQSFAVAASPIAGTFGMTVTEFGPAFAIGHLGACLGAMTCGPLSDTVGRKFVLVGAALTFAVFTIGTALAGSYHALLLIRFCAGLGLGGALPCFLALASEYAPASRRGTLASLLWAAYPLGGMIGGFAGSFLTAHYGWPMMFYVGGSLPILVALAMLVAMPESPAFLSTRDSGSPRLRSVAERIAGRHFPAGTRFITAERRGRQAAAAGAVRRRAAARHAGAVARLLRRLRAAHARGVLGAGGGAGDRRAPVAASAGILGFFNLGAVIGMGSAGRLVDRFGIGGGAGARRWAWPPWRSGCWARSAPRVQASSSMMLIGLFLGCGASGLIAVASTFYETRMRGTGIGWGMAIGRFGQVLGPLLTGMLLVRGLAIGDLMHALSAVPVVVAAAVLLARTMGGRVAPAVPTRTPPIVH